MAGVFEKHDPTVHTLARASGHGVVTGADADALYACFRDFGGWQRWLPETAFDLVHGGRGTEVGALRIVVFVPQQKFLYERLDALDDNQRVCTYSGVNYGTGRDKESYGLSASPFPGAFVDYTSTVRVMPITPVAGQQPSAYMTWEGEVWTQPDKAAELTAFLQAFYCGNIAKLNQHFAKKA